MLFLLHSRTPAGEVEQILGAPDYSYGVLHAAFERLLAERGEVRTIEDPAEAEAIHAERAGRGQDSVLLVFSPPHKAPIDLACPTACVFAWEFDTLPDEAWDDEPRNDWRHVFARHGRAIALSGHTAALVREAMGPAFPVAAIAAPVWSEWSRPPRGAAAGDKPAIPIEGLLLDSAWVPSFAAIPRWPMPAPSFPAFLLPPPAAAGPPPAPPQADPPPPPGPGARQELSLAVHHARQAYHAAFAPRLPRSARWMLSRAGRTTRICYRGLHEMRALGRRTAAAFRGPAAATPAKPAPAPRPPDTRPPDTPPASHAARVLALRGTVWTSVFNPTDGRKNWWDIVSAFLWAFRDDPDATLVLKLAHRDPAGFAAPLEDLLSRFAPFRCRVVAAGGWLPREALEALVEATDIVVNASHGEGLCLPLMEFMSAGVPAIAPTHTAMADYVDRTNAWLLRDSPEHNVWPHDSRDLFRTTRRRIDWESLVEAYRESARVARGEPARYAAMSRAATRAIERVASDDVVHAALQDFFRAGAFA